MLLSDSPCLHNNSQCVTIRKLYAIPSTELTMVLTTMTNHDAVLYSTVLSRVTIETEYRQSHNRQYDNLWSVLRPGQSAHCTIPCNARGVYLLMLCNSCYYSNSTCNSVGRAWSCIFIAYTQFLSVQASTPYIRRH